MGERTFRSVIRLGDAHTSYGSTVEEARLYGEDHLCTPRIEIAGMVTQAASKISSLQVRE
jgi:hypothetical protein